MSNEIALPTGQLPAYLRDYESESTEALITSGTVLPRISLRGKQFRFRKDDKERALPLGAPLKVVILGAAPKKGCSKIFYDDPYQEGSDDAPTCSSANGQMPDAWVHNPISPSCATCPKNAWGSGTDSAGNPTKGKACADTKQLLVLPPDQPEGEIWALRVPPASLKLLSNYGCNLKTHKIPIEGVITQIEFVDAEYPKIDFSYSSFIADQYATKFIERVRSDEFKDLIESLSVAVAVAPEEAAHASQPPQKQPEPEEKIDVINWGDDQAPEAQAAPESQEPESPSPAAATSEGVKAPDGSYYVSPRQETFDPEKHAKKSGCVAGSVTKDGYFKAKRGTASTQAPPPKEEPKSEPEPSLFEASDNAAQDEDSKSLQDILDEWG